MNSDKLSVIFLNLFIISFPLSVTASQSFAVLSVFFFLVSSYTNKNLLITLRNRAFVAAIGIYVALLPALLGNSKLYTSSLGSILIKSEISDFWMSFAVLPAFYHIRNSEYRASILRATYISALLIIVSGLVSIFTPFRLASYITAGFQVKEGARLQHFAGDFFGRFTYLPIGLMNTHLTFGGLCGLFFPGTIVNFLLSLKERSRLQNIALVLISILFAIVLFYNQSRSIWLGVTFSFGLISVKLFSSIEKEKIKIEYAKDNFFSELKENEILNARLQTVMQIDQFVGKYVSKEYVQRELMQLTDDQIKQMNSEMDAERKEDIAKGLIPDPSQMQPDQFQPQPDNEGPQQ
jgi:hypothetical protein